MTGLGYPDSLSQYQELQTENRYFPDRSDAFNERCDGTLLILNSNYQEAGKVKFHGLFPVELTGIPFDATISEQQYFTAQASFKYVIFDLIDNEGHEV